MSVWINLEVMTVRATDQSLKKNKQNSDFIHMWNSTLYTHIRDYNDEYCRQIVWSLHSA